MADGKLNVVADVVVTVADGMATCVGMFQYGRCYCHVADRIIIGSMY